MKLHIKVLTKRAFAILTSEGVFPLIKRSITSLSHFLFRYERLYLCENTIIQRNETYYLPSITDYECFFIENNEQADALCSQGYQDFREYSWKYRLCLERGAVAVLIYAGSKWANIGWVAFFEDGKRMTDKTPYHVDFAHNEASFGGAFTHPEYRGKGLMTFGYYKRLEYAREKGVRIVKNAVGINNMASRSVLTKFSPGIYAEGTLIQLIGFTLWRTKNLPV